MVKIGICVLRRFYLIIFKAFIASNYKPFAILTKCHVFVCKNERRHRYLLEKAKRQINAYSLRMYLPDKNELYKYHQIYFKSPIRLISTEPDEIITITGVSPILD